MHWISTEYKRGHFEEVLDFILFLDARFEDEEAQATDIYKVWAVADNKLPSPIKIPGSQLYIYKLIFPKVEVAKLIYLNKCK